MDLPLIIGVVMVFGLLIAAIVMSGGNIGTYISIDSIMIIAGGVIGSTLAGMTFKEVKTLFKGVKETILPKKIDWPNIIEKFSSLSSESRKEGVLSLQNRIEEQDNDLMRTGLQLIVDGADSEVLYMVLGTKIQIQKNTDKIPEKIVGKMGSIAPTFGLMGTVIGLIQVLGNLSEPEKLGTGISQAFMTTLYGVICNSIIFGPMAVKMERNNKEKARYYELILTGLQSIHEGDNPFIIEEKLKAFLEDKSSYEVVEQEAKEGAGDLGTAEA